MTEEGVGGAPEGNQHAAKHNLFSQREYLRENLSDWEQELFMEIVTDLLDRLEGDVAAYEREAIHNIALDVIKRNRANEHLTGNFDLTNERAFNAYSKLMRDTTKEMKELGLNVEAPEAKEAEAKQDWFDAIREAEEDD